MNSCGLLFKFETNYKEMKIKLLPAALMMFGFITCSKDSFNTKPGLQFISVNGSVFGQPSIVIFKLECTDKEGDVVDTLWVQRVSLVCPTDRSGIDSFPIPNFSPPKNVKAEFDLTYEYPAQHADKANLLGCSLANDTSYFRFWMHDKAQHVSDTVQTPNIVLLKQ
jgi:hypothetical protein